MKAYSPTGALIIATADTLEATAHITEDSFERRDDGSLGFDYSGESKMHWDTQTPKIVDDQPIYVDAQGVEWREDQLTLGEVKAPPAAEPAKVSKPVGGYLTRFPRADWVKDVTADLTDRSYHEWIGAKVLEEQVVK